MARFFLPRVLSIPRRGCVNVHGSILPKYRGAAPIARAIMMGEKTTGVTTMMMDAGMDTGTILATSTEILADDNLQSLHDRGSLGARLLLKTIEGLEKGVIAPQPQDHARATYAPKISKEEGRIIWQSSAQALSNLIRAFDPWPGAYTTWKGKTVKLFRPSIIPGPSPEPPGTVAEAVIHRVSKSQLPMVMLLIRELQMENRPRMPVDQFLHGNPLKAGQFLGE